MRRLQRVRFSVGVTLVSILLVGCGSMAPAPSTPITSMSQLEGKWAGTITIGFAGPQQQYFLTIHPDGSLVAQYGLNWQWGKIALSGGAATYEMTDSSTGTLQYFAGPRGRSITMTSTFGNVSVYVTPQG